MLPVLCIHTNTSNCFRITPRAHVMLMDDLPNEAYQYVITARLQSDPVERCFSQYRQMSGCRFLVSLPEVLISKKILQCRSLIKENINFRGEDLVSENREYVTVIEDIFDTRIQEIVESVLDKNSTEVASTIAWYVAKNLIKRSKCKSGKESWRC